MVLGDGEDFFKDLKNKFIQSNSPQMYLGPKDDTRVATMLAQIGTSSVLGNNLSMLDTSFAYAKEKQLA